MAWEKSGETFATVHADCTVRVWDYATTRVLSTLPNQDDRDGGGRDICFDPHNNQVIFSAIGGRACAFDLRTSKSIYDVNVMPGRIGVCRTMDANPNRPHFFLAAGDDGAIRFWDSRKLKESILQLRGVHSHWVNKARYNPFHDQLILSSSTDSLVCLWRATSVSSTPLVDLDLLADDGDQQEKKTTMEMNNNSKEENSMGEDGLIKAYDEHQDSVYACSWSLTDAWVFASLSYDGKLVVRTVPGWFTLYFCIGCVVKY